MIDFEAVRRAYFFPLPPGDHVPTVEERIAAYERQRVAEARRRGLDMRDSRMGEYGSLIGGPGKPPTRFGGGRPAEFMARMPPMPIEWFDHENAHRRVACADPERYLETLSADHLAGFEPRPDGSTLRRLLRAERLAGPEAHMIEQFLTRLRMIELAYLLSRGGLTIHEIARAMLLSGMRTPAKVHWLNQFAAPPAGRRIAKE
ncbi:MAG: hypothetical protein OXI73_02925 [Rhodospirillales bacterium]|nr:hypothetical protein [Rhodospirillales bacterium]